MSKLIFSGLESSGKSLRLAMTAHQLVVRNAKWNKITGKSRTIASNMAFKKDFLEFAKSLNVCIIFWKNLDDLVELEEADILCDEVGNYFDSRGWENLTLDVRRWLTQGAKTGIEFYGAAQDFAQVDIAFRRLVGAGGLKHIGKICGSRRPAATKPPVKRIWGVCYMRDLNPDGYDEKKKQFEGSLLPTFFFIRKKWCDIFDTSQKLVRSEPAIMRHEVRFCEHHEKKGGDGTCSFCKVNHI